MDKGKYKFNFNRLLSIILSFSLFCNGINSLHAEQFLAVPSTNEYSGVHIRSLLKRDISLGNENVRLPQTELNLNDILIEKDENLRYKLATDYFLAITDVELLKRDLFKIFSKRTYRNRDIKKVLSSRKRLDLIAKVIAVVLRRNDKETVKIFLEEILAEKKNKILLESSQLIESYLNLLKIERPIKISTSMGIYEGQIAIRTSNEQPDGEDAVRKKIIQYEDYFGLNPLVAWEIIYVNNGYDRFVDDPDRQERTSTMIMDILKNEYPHYLESGKIKVYEFSHELRTKLNSVHGGCTIYGMRKALQGNADIVIHNNIDLDCHTALTGNLFAPIISGNSDVTIGCNRMKGAQIRDYNKIRFIYSRFFNIYARILTPIGCLTDPQNAFKAFSADVLRKVLPLTEDMKFENDFDYHFTFPNQLICRACSLGYAVSEIPSFKHWSAKLATPKPHDSLSMVRGIWRQHNFHKRWLTARRQGKDLPVLCSVDETEHDGHIRVTIADTIIDFDKKTLKQRFCDPQDPEIILSNLSRLFWSIHSNTIDRERLSVLRKALSLALTTENSNIIADFLRRELNNKKFSGGNVEKIIHSFLEVYDIDRQVTVTTVLSLFRKEDYINPENLQLRIEQLEDLYIINPKVDWRLIVVYEPHRAYSDQGICLSNITELYPEYVLSRKIVFDEIPSHVVKDIGSWKGGSIMYGMQKARYEGADYIIFCDAKIAIDLCQEGIVLAPVLKDKKAIAIGSRRVGESSVVRNVKRRIMSVAYNRLVGLLLPLASTFKDTQCPLKCFSADAIDHILPVVFGSRFKTGYDYDLSFDTQLITNAILNGYSVHELAVIFIWPHKELSRIREGFRMLKGVVRQRQKLPNAHFIKDGREMDTYTDPNAPERVVKIPKSSHPAIVTKITVFVKRISNIVASSKSQKEKGLSWHAHIINYFIKRPILLRFLKWIQKRRVLRTVVVNIIAGLRGEKSLNIELLNKMAHDMNDVVADFRIEDRHLFLNKPFAWKSYYHGLVINQRHIPQFLEEILARKVKNGNMEDAKELISRAVYLQALMWQRGYCNKDINILNDVGLSSDGHMYLVDVGDITDDFDEAKRIVTDITKSIFHLFSILILRLISEELAQHYDNEIRSLYTVENLNYYWNMQRHKLYSQTILEDRAESPVSLENIFQELTGQEDTKRIVIAVSNGGKGSRQGLISLVSGSKGNIRVLGRTLKNIAGDGASSFSECLPKGKWFIWIPADSAFWALDIDVGSIKSQIPNNAEVVVLGFKEQKMMLDPPFSGIYAVRSDAVERINNCTMKSLTRTGIKKYNISSWWAYLVRPSVLTKAQWSVASGYDEIPTDKWELLWEKAQVYSQDTKTMIIASDIPVSNINSPQEIHQAYQSILKHNCIEDMALSRRMRSYFNLGNNDVIVNSKFTGRIISEGAYLIRNSVIKVPKGVELRIGNNVVIDDSILDIDAEPGDIVWIPDGSVISNSRISGRITGVGKGSILYKVFSKKGVEFRENASQTSVFLKDGRALLGITSIDFKAKENLNISIEGLDGISMDRFFNGNLIDQNKSSLESDALLSEIKETLGKDDIKQSRIIHYPVVEFINTEFVFSPKTVIFDWNKNIAVGSKFWIDALRPILLKIILGSSAEGEEIDKVSDSINSQADALGAPGLLRWAIQEARSKSWPIKSEAEYISEYTTAIYEMRRSFLVKNPGCDGLYDGIREFLGTLNSSGIETIILAGTFKNEIETIISEFSLGNYISSVFGREPGEYENKQAVKISKLRSINSKRNLNNKEYAMVSHDPEDIIIAKEMGMVTVGFAVDSVSRQKLIAAGADIIINRTYNGASQLLRNRIVPILRELDPKQILRFLPILERKLGLIASGTDDDKRLQNAEDFGLISFSPTNRCNLQCENCPYMHDNTSFPFKRLEKIVRPSPKIIDLTGGGEPTMYKDDDKSFNDLVNEIKTLSPNSKIRLFTNGVEIPEGKWQDHVSWVRVSVDNATANTFRTLKGADKYDAVIENLKKYMLGPIPEVHAAFLFQEGNIHEAIPFIKAIKNMIDEISPMVDENKLQKFTIQFKPRANYAPITAPAGWDVYDNRTISKNRGLLLSQIAELKQESPEFLEEHTNYRALLSEYMDSKSLHSVTCPYGLVSPYVVADGFIYPCCIMAILKEKAFGNIVTDTPEFLLGQQLQFYNDTPDYCTQYCRFARSNELLERALDRSKAIPKTNDQTVRNIRSSS